MDKEETITKLNSYNKNTLMETLGIEFVDFGTDFLVAKMPVSETVYQPMGILHGGATAALVETVGSCASAFFLRDENKVIKGLELSINHLKSKKDGVVFATAKTLHKGRTTHLWEVKVTDENNEMIAVAKITNIVLDKK